VCSLSDCMSMNITINVLRKANVHFIPIGLLTLCAMLWCPLYPIIGPFKSTQDRTFKLVCSTKGYVTYGTVNCVCVIVCDSIMGTNAACSLATLIDHNVTLTITAVDVRHSDVIGTLP
jgi:hypothetical protein